VKLTRLLLKYAVRIERGPDVDSVLRPDATLWFPNGEVWHVEHDTGHQRGWKIERRWKVYELLAKQWTEFAELSQTEQESRKPPACVLVVTQRKTMDGLIERARPYAAFMHFAFYNELMEAPYGEVIVSVAGRKLALEPPE